MKKMHNLICVLSTNTCAAHSASNWRQPLCLPTSTSTGLFAHAFIAAFAIAGIVIFPITIKCISSTATATATASATGAAMMRRLCHSSCLTLLVPAPLSTSLATAITVQRSLHLSILLYTYIHDEQRPVARAVVGMLLTVHTECCEAAWAGQDGIGLPSLPCSRRPRVVLIVRIRVIELILRRSSACCSITTTASVPMSALTSCSCCRWCIGAPTVCAVVTTAATRGCIFVTCTVTIFRVPPWLNGDALGWHPFLGRLHGPQQHCPPKQQHCCCTVRFGGFHSLTLIAAVCSF
jgi:hypothetical protein